MHDPESKDLVCYTIGHSNHSFEDFKALLKKHLIQCLVDVRSSPYSKYSSQFNKEPFSSALKMDGLTYVYMGDLLGGRYTDEELLFEGGTVNYTAVSTTTSFKEGLEKLVKNISKGLNIALMCSEKNPFDCHRFALISRNLTKSGVAIKHILDDGSIIAHEELEEKLLKKYKKEFLLGQSSFLEPAQSREEALDEAYEHLNKDIAFKVEEETEV